MKAAEETSCANISASPTELHLEASCVLILMQGCKNVFGLVRFKSVLSSFSPGGKICLVS